MGRFRRLRAARTGDSVDSHAAPSSGPAGHLPHQGEGFAGGHMGPPLRHIWPVYLRRGRCPHRPESARPGGRALRHRKLHTPQGGFSWPFGPIHLLVRFRLAAKASSFRCFDSPHATRCAAVGGFAALRMRPTPCGYFTGLARGPHNSPPCQRGQGTPKIINSQLSIPNS